MNQLRQLHTDLPGGEVGEQQVIGLGFEALERVLGRMDDIDVVTVLTQDIGETARRFRFVVDDEHLLGCARERAAHRVNGGEPSGVIGHEHASLMEPP